MEAQSQKEREKKCKIRANDLEIRNEPNAAADTDAAPSENTPDDADVEMTEIAEVSDTKADDKMDTDSKPAKSTSDESENTTSSSVPTSKNSTPETSPKTGESASSKETEQQESSEQSSAENASEPIQIEESVPKDENIINIDPRTYCKLGHFHLLLEDYPKGNLKMKWFSFLKIRTEHTHRA